MNQTIGVNITPQSFQQTLHYSQGDVGRVFVVNVTDYDIPSGATVTCVATKPSGMGFTVSGTVSGNSVTFTSTAEMTDEWGRFPAEIRIASGDILLGTANFLMIGEKDPHPASTIDGTQEELIPQLTLLVNRVEAAAESVHDLTVSASTLAAGSDATATYDSTNNSIAFGIPRGADGDVTRSEFNDLKSELEDVENLDDIAKTIRISDFAHGDMRSGSLVASNSFAYSSRLLPLSVGNIYFDDTKYQLIFLRCDAQGNVITYSSAKTTSPAEVVWTPYNKLQLYEKNNQSIDLVHADATTYYVEAKSTKIVEAVNSLYDDTYETKVEDVNLTEDLTNICYADNGGVGSTISENGSAETQYKAIIVPVKSGDSFKITGTGGSTYRLWCFTDTSRKILSVANAWATATNSTITASADGYLYYQISTAYAYSIIQLSKSVKYIRAEEDFKYLQTMTGFGMFQSIAGIGDSYTEGDMVKANGTWVTKNGINYLSAIGKRNGITANNYGSGGATTKTYLNRQAFADALADTPSDLYIFALGQNDINEATAKGTIADIKEDYTQNPNSFYGNYGRIISQIKNHAPHARFIIMGSWVKGISLVSGLDYQSYNDAIEEIAEHYGFPYINPFDDDFFNSKLYNNNMSNGHPTAMGYIGMSYAMERLFSKCVQENALYFKYALLD